MRKRLVGVIAIAALVGGACSSSSATPTAAPATPTPAPVVTKAPPAAPTPVASPTPVKVELTGTTYKAKPAENTGGTVVLAEWQYPDTVNPYSAQVGS